MTREEYRTIIAELELSIERATVAADRETMLIDSAYQKGREDGLTEALEIIKRVALGAGHGPGWDGGLT